MALSVSPARARVYGPYYGAVDADVVDLQRLLVHTCGGTAECTNRSRMSEIAEYSEQVEDEGVATPDVPALFADLAAVEAQAGLAGPEALGDCQLTLRA